MKFAYFINFSLHKILFVKEEKYNCSKTNFSQNNLTVLCVKLIKLQSFKDPNCGYLKKY